MMQVSKKIPFEDPQVLMGVRALYIVSNLIIIGIYLYMQQKINAKKGIYFQYLVDHSLLLIAASKRPHYTKVRRAAAHG